MRSVGSHTEGTAMGMPCTTVRVPDMVLSFSVPGNLLCESNVSYTIILQLIAQFIKGSYVHKDVLSLIGTKTIKGSQIDSS